MRKNRKKHCNRKWMRKGESPRNRMVLAYMPLILKTAGKLVVEADFPPELRGQAVRELVGAGSVFACGHYGKCRKKKSFGAYLETSLPRYLKRRLYRWERRTRRQVSYEEMEATIRDSGMDELISELELEVSLDETLSDEELDTVLAMETEGTQQKAAALLGISQQTMSRRLASIRGKLHALLHEEGKAGSES